MSDEIQFSIPDLVDTLDLVPEKFRSLYVEKDGKFAFSDPAVLARSLQNAKRERDEAKIAAKAAEGWKKLQKSPEEIEALIAAAEDADEQKRRQAGDWDAQKGQMAAEHQKKLDKVLQQHSEAIEAGKTENTRLRQSLEARIVDADATMAISELGGVSGLLLPHVQKSVKVIEEDGEFIAVVVNAKGEPRVDAKGAYLQIKDLVAEMRESEMFARAFDGSRAGGGGASPNIKPAGGSARRMTLADFNTRSAKERAALMSGGVQLIE